MMIEEFVVKESLEYCWFSRSVKSSGGGGRQSDLLSKSGPRSKMKRAQGWGGVWVLMIVCAKVVVWYFPRERADD